ncbi:MAG: hypothetical protein ACP5D2_03645 [Candidatus Nanoarchaeia archaeon]
MPKLELELEGERYIVESRIGDEEREYCQSIEQATESKDLERIFKGKEIF